MKTDRRWIWVALCLTGAVLLLAGGWLVPVHLRAVDAAVLQRAAQGQPSLVDRGLELQRDNNPEAARLLLQASQAENISGTEKLASVPPQAGSTSLFPGGPQITSAAPVTPFLIQQRNREAALAYLQANASPAVRALLRVRDLTNTVLFPASSSASGQAIDSAISLGGLLLTGDHLTSDLRDAILKRSTAALNGADPQPVEEILMSLMSLGQRFDWGQLTAFVGGVNDPAALTRLADEARNSGARLPELFSAVVLSQKPDAVADYLNNYSQTGLNDLSASLRYGEDGVDHLLRSNERLAGARATTTATPLSWYVGLMAACALRAPWFALMLKWFFFIGSGFLFAMAAHFARPLPSRLERPLQVRGFHFIREFLFALGFLLVVLLLSEPFLAQESQKATFAFHLRLPVAGVAPAGLLPLVKAKLMDTRSLITLTLFFVLQGLIYCVCLAKLAEIRRQQVPARVQLKLLENEEHLFDGGLYLGFAGTIICLILVSLGVIQQSLMAAYSSTSFGIIFVSIFKIFNLRPVRRRLLMQAEMLTPTAPVQVAPASVALATTTP